VQPATGRSSAGYRQPHTMIRAGSPRNCARAAPPAFTGRLRGRVREWKSVLGLLDSAATGRSGILLVDGAPGIGKTRLLAAAQDLAADHGFSLARAHADELPKPLPLAPLFAGLGVGPPGNLDGRGPSTRTEVLACLNKLAVQVGKRAAAGPTLITLDDLQWADETTAVALRALPAWLAGHPVGWVLVRRTGAEDPATDWLFEEWQKFGADRLELGPLGRDAVADVIADILQAPPDLSLLTLANGAAGNPQLLVALMDGLRDEGAVAIAGGEARLLSERPPRRAEEVIHDWVERLSPGARNLLEAAAFLDRSFAVDDLAQLLGWPTEQLLAPLHEAVACDLLTTVGKDVLTFQHDLVRQSVAHRVPTAVRCALDSQAKHAIPSKPVSKAWDGLTDSERTVAELVARGLTNREVAQRIFLSPHTVSFHLRKVYRKLGVATRVDLARLSIEQERYARV
jgi:DNA-binding CsgD family transcriptional regulator